MQSLKSERGLTLIEIIVVLIILSVVMAFFGNKIFGSGDRVKADITKLMMKEIQQNIEQYRLRYNQLPAALDNLTGCNDVTGPGCTPIAKAESLKDAWGNGFIYQLDNGGRSYRLKTLGADGREGGEEVNYDTFVTGP
ncbi:MAG: type II secretion system protein GspG [Oligoflexia bacterium]|nr:type II secretion system protein GspG [Oligoflexia bacterium]